MHRDTSSPPHPSILTDEGPSTLLTQGESSGSGPAIFLEELEREWERENPSLVAIETRTHLHAATEEDRNARTGQDGKLMVSAEKEAVSRFYFESTRARGAEEMKPDRADAAPGAPAFEGEDSGSGESVLLEIFPNAKISVEITLTKLTNTEPLDGPYTGNMSSQMGPVCALRKKVFYHTCSIMSVEPLLPQ